MNYSLAEIAAAVGGRLIGQDCPVREVSVDSRTISLRADALFVAIVSATRDGHAFVQELLDKGVRCFVVSAAGLAQGWSERYTDAGFVVVENTVDALQRLAADYRSQLRMPIVAVTGSAGKTITKELMAALGAGKKIFKSPKSYNSQIGVALSVLMIAGDENFCIIEAGISRSGEMARLERMLRPNKVVLTNIGEEHQENFGSYAEKLQEKLVLARQADEIIYPSYDPLVVSQVAALPAAIRKSGWGSAPEDFLSIVRCSGREVVFWVEGSEHAVQLSDDKPQTFFNTVTALAALLRMGYGVAELIERIPSAHAIETKFELIAGINGCKIIRDHYTTDLNSLRIALHYQQSVARNQQRVVILCDGVFSDALRNLTDEFGVSQRIIIGGVVRQSDYPHEKYFANEADFLKTFDKNDYFNLCILVKGPAGESLMKHFQERIHSTVLEVDLDALAHNFKYYRSRIAPSVKTVAMVKALAYGSGTYEIASTLADEGVDYLAVAYIDEGTILRDKGISKPILILNSNPADYETMLEHNLEPEIYNFNTLATFEAVCRQRGVAHYPIHIKIDTGMHRIGFDPTDTDRLCAALAAGNLRVASVFSHFSCADDPAKDAETLRQIALFETVTSSITAALGYRPLLHICNSAAIERFPQAHFDMVRIGIGLYGISPVEKEGLQSVSTLKSIVLQVKEVRQGEGVGYGMSCIALKDMTLATVSIGYADGLNRLLSNGKWSFRVGDALAPIVGRISMDNCMIDVTGIEVREGDSVTVFGGAADVAAMATVLGTIPYEVLTSVSARIKRRYIHH